MKTKICTDIEQSKKLLELGLNPKTADTSYRFAPEYGEFYLSLGSAISDDDIPAWSLSALIALMPEKINGFILMITKCMGDLGIAYVNEHSQYICLKDGEGSIEAAYKMVIWLIEKKLIKTEKV